MVLSKSDNASPDGSWWDTTGAARQFRADARLPRDHAWCPSLHHYGSTSLAWGPEIIRSTRSNLEIRDRQRLVEYAGEAYGVPEAEHLRLMALPLLTNRAQWCTPVVVIPAVETAKNLSSTFVKNVSERQPSVPPPRRDRG
jgi:hypothetical protein